MMNIQCTANNTTSQCLLNIPVNKPVDDYYMVEITPVNVDQGDIRGPTYYSPRISENLKQLKKICNNIISGVHTQLFILLLLLSIHKTVFEVKQNK